MIMNVSCRETTPVEKLMTSAINIAVAFVFLIPFFWGNISSFELKLIFISLFFSENLVSIIFHNYRLPGMFIQQSHWKKRYSKTKQLIHAILYTASFSTLLFWLWFPGDLFLLNLLLLQLPCVLLTKTTVHGLVAGKMVDMKQNRNCHQENRNLGSEKN